MTTLKERLLEALEDTTWEDLPEAALVEVLLEQMKRTKATLFEAQSALLKEGMRTDDIQRSAHEEIRQLRTNPLAAAHGDFYFCDNSSDTTYIVSIGGHRNIQMYRRSGRIDYIMAQIAPEEYAKRSQ
jgi:hypothetical protein